MKDQLKQLHEFAKKHCMCEKLILQRKGDVIYTVSDDAEESKKPFKEWETVRNKEKLKKAGFRFDGKAWYVPMDKLRHAQETIAAINNDPIEKFIDSIEDLPEFIDAGEDFSRKNELSTKIDTFIGNLATEVEDSKASAEFQAYLAFSSKFRKYSINNTILIYIQNPNASKVGSFGFWKKLHRHVKKGAKAIWIFKPITVKDDDFDGSNTQGLDGAVQRTKVVGFRPTPVFDVVDTEATDERGNIPDITWHGNDTPEEKADYLFKCATSVAKDLGLTVDIAASKHGEKGSALGDHINISSDVAGAGALGTLIHEIAHSLMHFKATSPFYVDIPEGSSVRNIQELQAETVSYVVLKHYDLPAQHHSTYLAIWKANKDSFKKDLGMVKQVSSFIIDKLDAVAEKGKKADETPTDVMKEMIYKGNVGFSELMDFYKRADRGLVAKVEELLHSGEEKVAWRVILRFLKKKSNADVVKEDWRGAVAGGMIGLAALSPFTSQATHKHKSNSLYTPTQQSQSISGKSLVDVLKHYENSFNNPKGGYDKSQSKWFPHHSIEGGSDTIAYGHKILPGENFSRGITDLEATQLLKKDIAAKERLAKSKMPKFDTFPEYVKNAIINAMYRGDLGPKTIKLINANQWDKVSSEYLNNKNYKSGGYAQIKARMKSNTDAFSRYSTEVNR